MASFSLTMYLNLFLLLAMIATNLLSFYHISTQTQTHFHDPNPNTQVPTTLLNQLHTIRATITQLTRPHAPSRALTRGNRPSDLPPIPTSCHEFPDLLFSYMNYTPFDACPKDSAMLAESLILRGCFPLPRRRCFSKTPINPSLTFLDSNVVWSNYPNVTCKSFNCLGKKNKLEGLNGKNDEFTIYKTDLDLTIPQLFDIVKKYGEVLRLGIDIGGESGNFGVKMRVKNVNIVTTTMNIGVPYNEMNAIRGVVAMHAPLQQRLTVFDGVVDLVRCGHGVNRWVPKVMLEFLLYDVDRVLRGGGFLWIDHFFSKEGDLEKVYKPMFFKLGYKIVKWAVGKKSDGNLRKNNGDVYLTALLIKPK